MIPFADSCSVVTDNKVRDHYRKLGRQPGGDGGQRRSSGWRTCPSRRRARGTNRSQARRMRESFARGRRAHSGRVRDEHLAGILADGGQKRKSPAEVAGRTGNDGGCGAGGEVARAQTAARRAGRVVSLVDRGSPSKVDKRSTSGDAARPRDQIDVSSAARGRATRQGGQDVFELLQGAEVSLGRVLLTDAERLGGVGEPSCCWTWHARRKSTSQSVGSRLASAP